MNIHGNTESLKKSEGGGDNGKTVPTSERGA
jgi:hypothetical protein